MTTDFVYWHRRNNRGDQGRLVPQLLGWGPTMYWSPNFLAVVFKMQEIHSKYAIQCSLQSLFIMDQDDVFFCKLHVS